MSFRTLLPAIALIGAFSLTACNGDGTLSPTPRPPQAVFAKWCNGLEPDWVAVQDGDSAWTQLQPTSANGQVTFHHDFVSDRGAIATLQILGGGFTALQVLYGTPDELSTVGNTKPLFCDQTSPISKVLLGGIVGVDTNETVLMAGDLSQDGSPWGGGGFSLPNISEGPHDVIAVRSTRINGQSDVTGFILRRDVDLPDSTYMPVVDFASNETITPVSQTLTLNGQDASGASIFTRLITPTSEVPLINQHVTSQLLARVFKVLPENKLRAGDLFELQAQAVSPGTGGPRLIVQYFRTPSDRSLTLPAALLKPTITTVATTPRLRLKAHFTPQADYDRRYGITYQQGTNLTVSVLMTAGYSALAGGYDLTVPDLNGVPGFDPAWALQAGTAILWNAGAQGGTMGLGVDALPADGLFRTGGGVIGSIP